MVQRVGEGVLQDWEAVAQQSRRSGCWTASPWAGEDFHRELSEFCMCEDLQDVYEAAERTGCVLEMGTAVEFLRDRSAPIRCIGSVWRPCQVTLFSDRLYMATREVEAVELQLDMASHSHWATPHYRWIVLRGREPQERVDVSDMQLHCHGNSELQAAGR